MNFENGVRQIQIFVIYSIIDNYFQSIGNNNILRNKCEAMPIKFDSFNVYQRFKVLNNNY